MSVPNPASATAAVSEHPDAAYIKRDDLGLVIAKGLAVMYKAQPSNPVDFLAKWLLNYSNIQATAVADQAEQKVQVKDLRDKHDYYEHQKLKEKEEREKEEQEKQDKIRHFYDKTIGESKDLNDQLQDLADFLKQFTNSTAVYVGKLVSPKRPIKEDDDDKAHVDADAQQIIHFLKATQGHEYLVDKILRPDQGLTFDVFKDEQAEAKPEGDEEAENPVPAKAKEAEEVLPRSVFVKEVVREPRMHFYKVPRLGSYLAIRLEYKSCLFEESLDAAVVDYLDVKQKQKEQEDEKRSFLEKMSQDKKEQEDEDDRDTSQLQSSRKWDDIKPKPFRTQTVSFVVCLNTLGQDREFTADEIKFAQRTVRDFAGQWEKIERQNLEQDVQMRLATIVSDLEYKKEREVPDNQELEKKIEEAVLPKEGEDPMDEELKQQTQRKLRHKLMTRAFYFVEPKDARPRFREHKQFGQDGQPEVPAYVPLPPNQWKESILNFAKYHVIKMPRIFQSLFYLLGYTREEVCERDTNKLEWKKAKHILLGASGDGADFFKRLGDLNPFGAKDVDFKAYQKLKFLKKNIKKHEQQPEQVDEYSIALGKLFKWLLYSIEMRVNDVIARREHKLKLKEERRIAEEAFAERERQRNEALDIARNEHEGKEDERIQALDADLPADDPRRKPRDFDEKSFLRKWDAENAKVEVPPAVVDDVDNDYDIAEEAKE